MENKERIQVVGEMKRENKRENKRARKGEKKREKDAKRKKNIFNKCIGHKGKKKYFFLIISL